MLVALLVYWIIAGFSTCLLPDPQGMHARRPVASFLISMALGGIIIPVLIILRLVNG